MRRLGPGLLITRPSSFDADATLDLHLAHELQRYLEQRVEQGAPWTWSALRPNPVCGFRSASPGCPGWGNSWQLHALPKA